MGNLTEAINSSITCIATNAGQTAASYIPQNPTSLEVWIVLLAMVGFAALLIGASKKGIEIINYLIIIPAAFVYFSYRIIKKRCGEKK